MSKTRFQVEKKTYYELDYRAIRSLFISELGLSLEEVNSLMADVQTQIYARHLSPDHYDECDREDVTAALKSEKDVTNLDWDDLLQELVVRKVLPAGRYLLWIF